MSIALISLYISLLTPEVHPALFVIMLIGLLILLIFNVLFILIVFTYPLSLLSYLLIFGVNGGIIVCSRGLSKRYLDLVQEVSKIGTIEKIVPVVICCLIVMATAGMYGLFTDDDGEHFWIPPHEHIDAEPYSGGNISKGNLTFTEDVVIEGDVEFSNCTLHFGDTFFTTYALVVMEGSSLTIRNTALDADYFFYFWVFGNLTLDNVTVKDLSGDKYSLGTWGGIFVNGNATIVSSKIAHSDSYGIFVYKGTLNIMHSTIERTERSAILADRSKIIVENCTFDYIDESIINMRDSKAKVSNSTFYYSKGFSYHNSNSNIERSNNRYSTGSYNMDTENYIFFGGFMCIGGFVILTFWSVDVDITRKKGCVN